MSTVSNSDISLLKDITLPLFWVFIGYSITEFSNYIRRRREVRDAGESFILEVNGILKVLSSQIKELDEYIIDLKSSSPQRIAMQINTSLNLRRIEFINKLFVYKYFSRKIGNKKDAMEMVDNLYAEIESIEYNVRSFVQHFEIFQVRMRELSDELNIELKNILLAISNWAYSEIKNGRKQNEIESDELFKYMKDVAIPIINRGKELSVFELNEHLLDALFEKCYFMRNHPVSDEIRKLTIRSGDIVNALKADKDKAVKLFTMIIDCIKSYGDNIKIAIQKYEIK